MLSRTFSSDDQVAFAKLSGDYNDLHLDAIAARRSLFGTPVVHGINALLWALNSCLPEQAASCEIVKLEAIFIRQIAVGEEVYVEQITSSTRAIKLKLFVADGPVATVKVEFRELLKESGKDRFNNGCPLKVLPIDLSAEELKSAHGDLELFLDAAVLRQLYPRLAASVSPLQIAIILGSTRIVGVYCPGKYSLYSELELAAVPDTGNKLLSYKVASKDDRFGLLAMDFIAPNMTGVIRAFHRPAPQKQKHFTLLRTLVATSEFSGQRALIIGGSRGLGEVVAKLLAAGGADVKITYHQGQEDARALVNEIVSNGGIADHFPYNVLSPKIEAVDVSRDRWYPTHLYYFATPPILASGAGKFSAQKFRRYCDFYVIGLTETLNILGLGEVKQIFCPSTVYVEDPPPNLGEYAAAKAAGESVGDFLRKTYSGINVYAPRLPRLATDQTSNVAGVESGDPVPVLLAELRAFRALAT